MEARPQLHLGVLMRDIKEAYFGLGIGEVVAVFLFRIELARESIDQWLWAVVGDLPPAYLETDEAKNPAAALDGYIGEMERWVEALGPKGSHWPHPG